MSDSGVRAVNPARRFMIIFGAIALPVGLILWVWGASRLAAAQKAQAYYVALGGGYGDDFGAGGDQSVIYLGVGLGLLGLIFLIIVLATRAAQRQV